MSKFKQIAAWTISIMASVVIFWNAVKAIMEMYAGSKQFLRLRAIRIQGQSGNTHFNNNVKPAGVDR